MTPERAVPGVCKDLCHYFEQGPDVGPALVPYRCPAGRLTIGYGHVIGPDDPLAHARITHDTADQLLAEDLDEAAAQLESMLSPAVRKALLEQEFAALVDFVFNEGAGNFHDSTLRRLVNEAKFNSAVDEFPKWKFTHVNGKPVELPGLVKRRKAEVMLWQTGRWR